MKDRYLRTFLTVCLIFVNILGLKEITLNIKRSNVYNDMSKSLINVKAIMIC